MGDTAATIIGVLTIVVALLSAAQAWLVWIISALQKADARLAEQIGKLEVLVAGDYVKRGEFHDTMKNQTVSIEKAIAATGATLLLQIDAKIAERDKKPTTTR